jgi:hypothetical protein
MNFYLWFSCFVKSVVRVFLIKEDRKMLNKNKGSDKGTPSRQSQETSKQQPAHPVDERAYKRPDWKAPEDPQPGS